MPQDAKSNDLTPAGTTPAGLGPGFLDPAIQEPQPWARLRDHLAVDGMELADDPAPKQFAGGFGNLNYLVVVDGTPTVLRRPPAGPLPPGGNDMGREYRVLSRLWQAFPLAPRAHHFCEDESVLGAPFFLMEYRPGLVVHDTLPGILASQGRALSEMMVEVLAAFHAVSPAEVDLDTLGRPDGFLSRAVAGWIKRCGVASADIFDDRRPPAAAREVAAWLEAQPVPPGEVSLLHNDYKLNNIVLDPERPTRPIALLDWDMCTRGDPLFDLGTLLGYWTEAGDPPAMQKLNQMPTAEPGFLTRRQVVALYAERTGRDVSDFLFHQVLGMYKLGVVFLQLYARHCRGTTSDPRYARLGEIGTGIFDFAVDIMRGRAT